MPYVEETSFVLKADPDTDLWRKPPSTNSNNAPFKALCSPIPLKKFQSAGVTFSGDWQKRYDQGGVALFFTKDSWKANKWVKSGVEFYNDKPNVSTVTTDNWSDWSLTPITTSSSASGTKSVTIEIRRESDELGSSLWAYQLLFDDEGKEVERVSLRECAWPFAEEEGVEIEVGASAARPAKGEKGEVLEVKFDKAWLSYTD